MNDTLVTELAWQMGRPPRYGGEIAGISERAGWMAENAAAALAPIDIEDSLTFVRRIERAPRGVVLIIAPWNYPYLVAINGVFPALIAGNAVVLTPGKGGTPAATGLADLLRDAGLPSARCGSATAART